MTVNDLRRLRQLLKAGVPSRSIDAEIASVFGLLSDMDNESWELAEDHAPDLTYSVDQALRFGANQLDELAINIQQSDQTKRWTVRYFRSTTAAMHEYLPIAILIAVMNVLIDKQKWSE